MLPFTKEEDYRFIETESKAVVATAWEQGEMVSCLFNAYRLSFLEDEKKKDK